MRHVRLHRNLRSRDRVAGRIDQSEVTTAGPIRAGSGEISCSIVIVREESAGLEQAVASKVAAQAHSRNPRHFPGSGRTSHPLH